MSHDLLFVDNDSLFLNRCQDLFAGSPYQLHFVRSSEQGLALLLDGLEPVVMVVNQSMPKMNGPVLLGRVRELQSVASFIMVVGSYDHKLVMQAVNHGGLFRLYDKEGDLSELKKGVMAGVSACLHRRQDMQAAEDMVDSNVELGHSIYNLEKRIEARTQDLQKSYDENVELTNVLKQSVCELEGRDRILRHLLTIHELEETLLTILEVINDVLSISCGAMYLKGEKDEFQQVCVFPEENQSLKGRGDVELVRQAMDSGRLEVMDHYDLHYTSVVVPICKGESVLGVIEVVWDHDEGGERFSEDELMRKAQVIYTFTVHAAIAISDHNIGKDKSSWSKTLDDVLLSFME